MRRRGRPLADVWLGLGGLFVIWLFFRWERAVERAGRSRSSVRRCCGTVSSAAAW
jgi:hypothetical protein